MKEEKRNKLISKKKGFTLIELLVVVLIIGILAAIALPQYRKAIFSSRMKEMEMALRTMDTAYAEYQLIHGKSVQPLVPEDVSITLSSDCTNIGNASGWGLRFGCKNFSVGYTTNINKRQSSAYSNWTPRVYLYFENGKFVCRQSSMDEYPIYREYCERMGYL
jgi:prepilin-type N-terminal cleavage/methylation domain-containing protein